ncbi:hypothetical protein Csa_005785 [Cucumis sativus]|uniref:Uncharacterized protein n=1 Tax=Cucumis sativus TaxID=3659 RepID=A0A0A0KSK6_CUCSA|nr:hypothetical protein Csa_005785 [Cucumis sativus]
MGEIPKFYRTAKARKEAHQNKNPPEVTKIVEEKRQSAVKRGRSVVGTMGVDAVAVAVAGVVCFEK